MRDVSSFELLEWISDIDDTTSVLLRCCDNDREERDERREDFELEVKILLTWHQINDEWGDEAKEFF